MSDQAQELEELQRLASELQSRIAHQSAPARWNADPEDVRRSVMQLVLTLVDFIRQVMERQALRRMGAGKPFTAPHEIQNEKQTHKAR